MRDGNFIQSRVEVTERFLEVSLVVLATIWTQSQP